MKVKYPPHFKQSLTKAARTCITAMSRTEASRPWQIAHRCTLTRHWMMLSTISSRHNFQQSRRIFRERIQEIWELCRLIKVIRFCHLCIMVLERRQEIVSWRHLLMWHRVSNNLEMICMCLEPMGPMMVVIISNISSLNCVIRISRRCWM